MESLILFLTVVHAELISGSKSRDQFEKHQETEIALASEDRLASRPVRIHWV